MDGRSLLASLSRSASSLPRTYLRAKMTQTLWQSDKWQLSLLGVECSCCGRLWDCVKQAQSECYYWTTEQWEESRIKLSREKPFVLERGCCVHLWPRLNLYFVKRHLRHISYWRAVVRLRAFYCYWPTLLALHGAIMHHTFHQWIIKPHYNR